ncbi:MAG TPA: sulfotransferase [Steroidobacteraceae bacterium]|nr:sulfotransferase [Steroidobacteraceae bacterium]
MNSAAELPPPELPAHSATPLEREVHRIRELTRGRRYGEALAAIDPLLGQFPLNRDLLYLAAINLRYLNRFQDALEVLQRLEQHHPRYARLYQERGHCYVALRDAPRAIEAFLRGVNINPALPASWSMLHSLYRLTGDQKNAATAAEHIATLRNLPPPIVQAGSLFSDGELTPAENIVRAYLLHNGNHIEAMRLLARIGLERDILDDAELLLESVLELAPDYRAARLDYARALYRRQKYLQSRQEVEKLLALDPHNREYLKQYAASCVGLGDYEPIIELYRRLLADTPQGSPEAADLQLWIAHALKTLGRQAQAIDGYRAALAARPEFGEAWWSLANLKTYRFADEDIAQMRAAEAAAGTGPVDRYHLCFALGKALEDRGDYAGSWGCYERGNALKRAEGRYLPRITEINTRLSRQVCTREFFEARRGWGVPAPDPIFILGLPRSGSTLIEQILASHSQVEGTQELADIQRIVMELRGRAVDLENPRFPGILAELSADDIRRFGERFMADTRIYRRTGRPFFIDKMPNNFRYLGLIHLMLPNAKLIDARREPMACCFGNLKQLFSSGQEFSYGIEEIARYYRTYLELMQHWNEVLPGRILRVQHEDVVGDLEGSVRRILDHCGLEFEPACLEFHLTERSVRTASSEQVRRPISREGLEQWKQYEPWLAPLREALGDALQRYRD